MAELIEFKNLAKVLEEYAIAVRDRYKENLIKSDRVASGELLNSIEYVTHFQGNDYWVGLNLEGYWKYIEYDTKPHMPPVSAILKWIQIKPVIPHPFNGKLPTPTQLAWAISKKIEREGTKGKPDLRDATKEFNKVFEERITEAIDKDIAETADGVIRVLFTQ